MLSFLITDMENRVDMELLIWKPLFSPRNKSLGPKNASEQNLKTIKSKN